MAENKAFNKKSEYNGKVKKLVNELKSLCKKENIPFFFAACVENSKKDSRYELEMLSAEICDTKLSKDWISKFVDITIGFDAVPPAKPLEIDSDDLG